MAAQLSMFARTPAELVIYEARSRDVEPSDVINTARRTGPVVAARHAIARILRDDHGMSYPAIGKVLCMDHTSVMYACRKASA